jgi:hypothetical protein
MSFRLSHHRQIKSRYKMERLALRVRLVLPARLEQRVSLERRGVLVLLAVPALLEAMG